MRLDNHCLSAVLRYGLVTDWCEMTNMAASLTDTDCAQLRLRPTVATSLTGPGAGATNSSSTSSRTPSTPAHQCNRRMQKIQGVWKLKKSVLLNICAWKTNQVSPFIPKISWVFKMDFEYSILYICDSPWCLASSLTHPGSSSSFLVIISFI